MPDVGYSGGSAGQVAPGDGPPHVLQDEGVDLAARTRLNFAGAGVTATDDAVNDRTVVTVPGGGAGAAEPVGDWIALAPYLSNNWAAYPADPPEFYLDRERVWFRGFVVVTLFDDDPGDIVPSDFNASVVGGTPLEAQYWPVRDVPLWTYDWRWTSFETDKWHIVTAGTTGWLGVGGMFLATGTDATQARLSLHGLSYRVA